MTDVAQSPERGLERTASAGSAAAARPRCSGGASCLGQSEGIPRSAATPFLYRQRMSTILEFRGAFRLSATDGERLRGRGRATWLCRCGAEATPTRGPRCSVCASGGDCGRDCTTIGLACPSCGQTA